VREPSARRMHGTYRTNRTYSLENEEDDEYENDRAFSLLPRRSP
jgi:hypothetical protein